MGRICFGTCTMQVVLYIVGLRRVILNLPQTSRLRALRAFGLAIPQQGIVIAVRLTMPDALHSATSEDVLRLAQAQQVNAASCGARGVERLSTLQRVGRLRFQTAGALPPPVISHKSLEQLVVCALLKW